MKLVVASNNEGKIREIKFLLEPLGIEIFSQTELGVNDIEETGKTFVENHVECCKMN